MNDSDLFGQDLSGFEDGFEEKIGQGRWGNTIACRWGSTAGSTDGSFHGRWGVGSLKLRQSAGF